MLDLISGETLNLDRWINKAGHLSNAFMHAFQPFGPVEYTDAAGLPRPSRQSRRAREQPSSGIRCGFARPAKLDSSPARNR